MKRSVLMSALVLALACPLAACGGGSGPDAKTEGGGDAKPGDDAGDDPIVQLQKISDGIQHDVDALLQPIKDADGVLDGMSKLAADLKTAKAKFDSKKLSGEIQKIIAGNDADIDGLKLDDANKAKVTERFQKLKDLMAALKNVDQAAKDLGSKMADALLKAPPLVAKVVGKASAKLAAPFGVSDADKKQAQADKDKVTKMGDELKAKISGWQSDITSLPGKAKDVLKKVAALK